MSFGTIIDVCKRSHITTLFVTDHNEIDGARRLQAIAPFRVIPSEEIATSEGEIIGYFLQERIPPGLTPEATIAGIRAQGGLVAVPHPFDRLRHSRLTDTARERILGQVDMLEVYNSRNVFPSDDRQAERYCRQQNKHAFVGSDAHSRWEVGRSWVEIPPFTSPADFLRSLPHATLHPRRSSPLVHLITKYNKVVKF